MKQLTTTNYTNCTNWLRRSWHVLFLLAIANFQLSVVNSVKAQSSSDAFYIYQNDGHFDGFFYDEVEKITYSRVDTAGIEWDDFVSQEIVTADSTYRIMLSAIDSVGFVQPEVKFNPHAYIRQASYENEVLFEYMYHFDSGGDEEIIVFYRNDDSSWLPMPQVGDVFVDFDTKDGWSAKIASLTYNYPNYEGYLVGICKPIDDITDIFQDFVCVEEYGYTPEGKMVSRRMAGRPDLTIGEFPRKASEGKWEGDLFNFSLAGHITLYSQSDLTVTIDPSIEGKLNVKAAWNLSWLGKKYIGITTHLKFGVGVGFGVDGKIADFFPGGVGGLLGGVPIPATCPIIYLDITPDAFLRGEAHVKFSAQSPRLAGSMWAKLEINNWVPSMAVNFGNPDGKDEDFERVDMGAAGLSLELSGFVQGGMLFPMTFKSLPAIKKLFNASIGGRWFVGPKLAGSIALDLTAMPWEGTSRYKLLKNTKLQLHMLDADYEVTADVEVWRSGKKNVTLADGSVNLFPPLDAAFAPEFENCVEYTETRMIQTDEGNKWLPCHIFAFKPSGAVVMPVDITVLGANTWKNYYHIHQLMGQDVPKNMWAELVIPYNPGNTRPTESREGEEIFPMVKFFEEAIWAEPTYKVWHGAQLKASCDTLVVSYDYEPITPITFTGNCDQIASVEHLQYLFGNKSYDRESLYKWLKVSNKEITVDTKQARQRSEYGASINFSPSDTLKLTVDPNNWWNSQLVYYGLATVEGELFCTRRHDMTVWALPNRAENPNQLVVRHNTKDKNGHKLTTVYDDIQSTLDKNTWTCSATKEWESSNLIPDYVPVSFNGKITEISYKRTTSMTFGKETSKPWHFGGGSDVLITKIKYEAQDSKGNYIRDSKGEIVIRSVTVTERTTWNPYDTSKDSFTGAYHLFGLDFKPSGQKTVTTSWSTGTTDTQTYDEVPEISPYWYEDSEDQQ